MVKTAKITSTKKRFILPIVAGIVVALIIVAIALLASADKAPSGMKQLHNYIGGPGICTALTPECGYCPGEIIDKKCYVNKDDYERYK